MFVYVSTFHNCLLNKNFEFNIYIDKKENQSTFKLVLNVPGMVLCVASL